MTFLNGRVEQTNFDTYHIAVGAGQSSHRQMRFTETNTKVSWIFPPEEATMRLADHENGVTRNA